MEIVHVSIRELKSGLSRYLRMTKAGQPVVITELGKPIGRIVPLESSLDDRLGGMIQAGQVQWSGRKLRPHKPTARVRGAKTVADLLVEDRE